MPLFEIVQNWGQSVEIKVVPSGNLKLYEELLYIVLKTNIR